MAWVLPGLLLSTLLGALDQTIMAPALPAVATDLGGLEQMPSVVISYLIATTVAIPIYGKLGDRFGRKPMLQVAIGLFVVGAVLCALATTMTQLVAFRVIQGLGGGGLVVGAQATIGEVVSPRERGRYLGWFGATYLLAVVGGPLVGGFLIDNLSWRWIFGIYPVVGVAALVAVSATLHLPRPKARLPFDIVGALSLATAAVAAVLLGETSEWLFAVVGVVAVVAWAVSARFATDPIVPLRFFRDRAIAIPLAISFLIGFALFGTITYIPAFLQLALGVNATGAGLTITALMAGAVISIVTSGQLITRTGAYRVYPIVGTALAAVSLAAFAFVGAAAGIVPIVVILFLIGLGVGMVMQVMVLAAQNAAPYRDLGAATSTVTFLRQMGASTGVAAVGALISLGIAGASSGAAAMSEALPKAFGFMAPLLGLACLLAFALPARPLRTTAHVEAS